VKIVALALRLGLAALFLWAGGTKLIDPSAFAEEIANYHLVPSLAPWLAATLPTMEVVTGLALAVAPNPWRGGAALLSLLLLSMFTIAVGAAWTRGIDVRCGCFGKGGGPIDGLTVVRDLAFVAWAALVLRLSRSSGSDR
jgi:hypothetical protein